MPKIDSPAQLAEIIRQQVGSLRQSERTPSQKARTDGGKISKGKSKEEQDIASLVAQRVCVIDPDDPQRNRKAFHIFLESVLLAEIGKDLINDPGFHQLIDKIQQQMEEDVELSPLIQQAAALLLSNHKPEK